MCGQLDDARYTWADAIAGLAQVVAGVAALAVVDDERSVLEDAHVERRDDGLELGRWLAERIWVGCKGSGLERLMVR